MTNAVFALVHYHNAGGVRAAIERIRALQTPAGWAITIIVADNSGDAPPDLGVRVVNTGHNAGYLGGAAAALEAWRADEGVPSWFVICNPDAEPRADAMVALASMAMADDVGMVAPSVLLGGTTPQNPFLAVRPSRARMRFYTVAFRSAWLTRVLDILLRLKRRRTRLAGPARQPRLIYAPHGSFICVRSSFFNRGGTLAYRGFMFGEEIHLAEQARQLGLGVLFAPAVEVIHRGGSTTDRIDAARRREWHRLSADVLWEDYFR